MRSTSRRRFLRAAPPVLAASQLPKGWVGEASGRRTVRDDSAVSLGFAGDAMFGRGVNERHGDAPPEAVWGDLLPRIRALDGFFVNLECCLSERGTRQPDRAYYFRADPDWSVPALREAEVTFASLANNHVLDYGEEALVDTVRSLADAGVSHAGAGRDIAEARRPATVSVGGLDVAVIACTDNAPSYAAHGETAGTWYVDIGAEGARAAVRETLAEIREERPDVLVASVHWGPNWVVEPAQRYREFARWLVDQGVDVVHGHSAHVFQGVEIHDGRPILYDCGDLVDDYAIKPELRNDRSFLFELSATASGPTALHLRPVEIRDETVVSAGEEAAEWARSRMRRRSSAFDTEFVREGRELMIPLRESDGEGTT